MGLPIDSTWVQQAADRGLIPADALAPVRSAASTSSRCRRAHRDLVEQLFVPPPTWVIPCLVLSLANSREWQTRTRTAPAHRRAFSIALGKSLQFLATLAEHDHVGGELVVKLTYLGGRPLDCTANLPASSKHRGCGCAHDRPRGQRNELAIRVRPGAGRAARRADRVERMPAHH